MKYQLLLVLLLISSLRLHAQGELPEDYQKISLKYYPNFLFDVSGPSIEGGLEYRFSPEWSVQLDYGYISTWDGRYFLNVDDIQGFRMRALLRKYRGTKGGYHALSLGYKGVTRYRTDTYCLDDCNYFQEIDYDIYTNDISAHYLFGIKLEFLEFGLIEFNGGAGLRIFRRESNVLIPEDAILTFNNGGLRIREDRWLWIPSALLTMQIGFGL